MSIYHPHKNHTALFILVFTVFVGGVFIEMLHETISLSQREKQEANVVGVNASVDPNPFNTLAAELERRERSLADRERALLEQEAGGGLTSQGIENFLVLISLIGFLLLSLILTNFYFDWKRRS